MANTRLTRTPSSAGNRRTWTFSAWIKRSKITSDQQIFVGDSPRTWIVFRDTDKLQVFVQQDFQLDVTTNMLFRDTSAWYHIVVGVDTTQASQNDRVKIYVNGSLVDVTNSYAVQNYETGVNNTGEHYIGRLNYADSSYFNGSMSHIHLCDGTQYQASDFGEYDANGVWTIKTSPSVTYGTNGFFILKNGNSVTDQSGNSNNWTVASGTLTNTEDNPSNVFATMNPLNSVGTGTNPTFSNGNLRVVSAGGTSNFGGSSTIGMLSGKWYLEAKATVGNGVDSYSRNVIGVTGEASTQARSNVESGTNSNLYYSSDSGAVTLNGSTQYTASTYVTNDIIQIAIDMDNLKVYFGKNGTWLNSSDPTSGATGTGAVTIPAISSTTDSAYFIFNSDNSGVADSTSEFDFNFGNGYFETTAVASAGTNASGIGIFEYDVPTGYTALSTKGLNL